MRRACLCGSSKCRHRNTRPAGPDPYGASWHELVRRYIKPDTRCSGCGGLATPDNGMTLDHILPISLGGTNHPDNLRPLHRKENSSKGGGQRFLSAMTTQGSAFEVGAIHKTAGQDDAIFS